MTEKFESIFHKRYVGGQGEVCEMEKQNREKKKETAVMTTLEDVLFEYRKYVNDPKAELPEIIMDTFLAIQRTENERK